VIAVLGLGLFGCASWHFLVVGSPIYRGSDLKIIHGKLLRAREIRVARSDALQIELFGQPISFRGGSVSYARCYDRKALALLATGCEVDIGVLPDEERKPWRDYLTGQQFLNIYSLAVNGEVALSLEDFNRCARANERIGKIIPPILLIISIVLLISALRMINEKRKAKEA